MGVILLGVLLYTGAGVVALAGLVVPAANLSGLPRGLLLLYALVLGILATGLLRRRRWAWFAMLAFVVVNGYYLLLGAAAFGQNIAFGLGLLAAIATYLLSPGARSAFLKR